MSEHRNDDLEADTPPTETTLQDGLLRAVVLARGLRESFGLDAQNVQYLLERWRVRHDVDVPRERLQLVVRMVFADPPPAPMTKKEAETVVAAAVADFADTPEVGRATLRAWCYRRGGMTGTQVQRLLEAFTAAVRAKTGEVSRAA